MEKKKDNEEGKSSKINNQIVRKTWRKRISRQLRFNEQEAQSYIVTVKKVTRNRSCWRIQQEE